jgi:hypothetical protein
MCLFAVQCNNSSFAGKSKSASPTTTEATPGTPSDCVTNPTAPGCENQPGGIPTTPGSEPGGVATAPCIQGQKGNFRHPDAQVQACMDKKWIWDFNTSRCAQFDEVKTFTCTFAGFDQAAQRVLNKKVDAIEQASKQGAILVGCGERDNGAVIVAQWVVVTEGQLGPNCELPQNAMVVNACFMGGLPPVGTENMDAAQRAKLVSERCLFPTGTTATTTAPAAPAFPLVKP